MNKHPSWLFEVPQGGDLSKRSTRNVGINVVAQGIRFVLQIASTVILARLLTPADFGLVAMVTVLVHFIGLFKDAGLAQATVQRQSISHEQISSLFWINGALTCGLACVVAALAPVIVWIYGEPRLFWLSVFLALPILLSGFWLQHRALLQRHMRFVAIARADILAYAVGVAVGIFAAYHGARYWALVYMTLTVALASAFAYWSETGWVPSAPRRRTGVRGMLRFGANLTGFNLVNYFSRNADNFLIGKFIGADALGQYSRAYSLMILPISQVNAPIRKALLPALSRLQNDPDAFAALYLRWVKRIAWLTAIPIASAAIWGREVVTFMLGAEWRAAGEIFEWLAVASFLQPLTSFSGVVFIAQGKTKQMFKYGVFASCLIVIGFVIGVQFSLIAVAVSYAITSNMNSCILLPYMAKNAPFSVAEYLRVISPVLGLSLPIVLGGLLLP